MLPLALADALALCNPTRGASDGEKEYAEALRDVLEAVALAVHRPELLRRLVRAAGPRRALFALRPEGARPTYGAMVAAISSPPGPTIGELAVILVHVIAGRPFRVDLIPIVERAIDRFADAGGRVSSAAPCTNASLRKGGRFCMCAQHLFERVVRVGERAIVKQARFAKARIPDT